MSTMTSATQVYSGPSSGGLFPSIGSVSSGEAVTAIFRESGWIFIEYTVDGSLKKSAAMYCRARLISVKASRTLQPNALRAMRTVRLKRSLAPIPQPVWQQEASTAVKLYPTLAAKKTVGRLLNIVWVRRESVRIFWQAICVPI